MATLISPKGDRYETEDPREINNLTLGHGYRYADQDTDTHADESTAPQDQPADQRGEQAR